MANDGRLTPTALYRAVLLAFGLLAVIFVFPDLSGVLLLLLLIVLVAVPLSSATGRLERLHVPRGLGAPLLLLATVAVIGGGIALLVPIFSAEANRLVDVLPATIADVRRSFGHVTHGTTSGTNSQIQTWANGYLQHPQRLLGPAASIGAGVAGLLTTLVVVAITAVYTAIRPRPLEHGMLRLVPPPRRGDAARIMHRLALAYVGWLRGLAIGMLVLGVLTYAGLRAIGLPFALVFAAITALAMVVPYFGALASAIPPILLALTISPGKALVVTGLYVVAHQIEGHIIEPLVMARALELHPAMVAVGVIAVERLFGFVWLFVAVPILVTVKILVEELWVRPIEERYGAVPPGEAGEAAPPSGVPETARRFRRVRPAARARP